MERLLKGLVSFIESRLDSIERRITSVESRLGAIEDVARQMHSTVLGMEGMLKQLLFSVSRPRSTEASPMGRQGEGEVGSLVVLNTPQVPCMLHDTAAADKIVVVPEFVTVNGEEDANVSVINATVATSTPSGSDAIAPTFCPVEGCVKVYTGCNSFKSCGTSSA